MMRYHVSIFAKIVDTSNCFETYMYGTNQKTISADSTSDNKFNGLGVGMYTTSNLKRTTNKAYYRWFEYKKLD